MLKDFLSYPYIFSENILNIISINTDANIQSLYVIISKIILFIIIVNIFLAFVWRVINNKFIKWNYKNIFFLTIYFPFISPLLYWIFWWKINKKYTLSITFISFIHYLLFIFPVYSLVIFYLIWILFWFLLNKKNPVI